MCAMAGPTVPQEFLKAENVGLRMLLEQAGIDARALLAQAGIEAKEREAADRLQTLILEELHHRIKNTLATVSATIADSDPLIPATEYRTKPSEAATSTMQMAMKIVEMRIMSRAMPSRRHKLSINVDSTGQRSLEPAGTAHDFRLVSSPARIGPGRVRPAPDQRSAAAIQNTSPSESSVSSQSSGRFG